MSWVIGEVLDCMACSHVVGDHWGPDTSCTREGCPCATFTIHGTIGDTLATFAHLNPEHPKVAELLAGIERRANPPLRGETRDSPRRATPRSSTNQ